jgi:transcriptional regulator with PAS, ATPase and Fis domain
MTLRGADNGGPGHPPIEAARAVLVGASLGMHEVYGLIELAASSPAPAFISGETGTGKELVARAIHERSARREKPFVAVNCSAIPEPLLESELFGYDKGAFTGALESRAGYFETAHTGTIFLDEISEMSSSLQAKYLRVLQDGSFRRLGGGQQIKVDVRVIAATNRDVARAVEDGTLREDLYFRLNVVHIPIPPLRERQDDIPLLVEAFIAEFNDRYGKAIRGADRAGMRLLRGHTWPGNVRELRNTVERGVLASGGNLLDCESLRFVPIDGAVVETGDQVVLPIGTTLEEGERELILRTLRSVGNNKTKAAGILGVTPRTLHNKIRRWADGA